MTPEHILYLLSIYEEGDLEAYPPKRIDPSRKFSELNRDEILSHARYLCQNLMTFLHDPEKEGKIGRHFGALQMCLSFAGLYTLEDLMSHNR